MQERFCTCGHRVYVAYIFTSRGVYPLFRPQAGRRDLMKCPACGRPINIDELW